MRQGWETEARNWAYFARMPGHDGAHENINLPALREILPAPGRATLDLACGEGRLSRLLAALGHRITGIDSSPTLTGLAATHEAAAPVLRGDAAGLPFRDGAFDLVLAYMCLHDIDAMPAAVAEIARVLEPGGRLCLAIPYPLNSAGSFQGRDPDAPFIISGSYLDARPTGDVVERDGVRLTFHSEHRPLETYLRALEDATLLTETIREVRPSLSVTQARPSSAHWRRIPLFLHLRAIKPEMAFRQVTSDFQFARVCRAVKLSEFGTAFMSRSEARSLLDGLSPGFDTAEVDFTGVSDVGQGFVDELIRVWPAANPGKAVIPVNMNPAVEFMVRRGLSRVERPNE